MRKIFLISPILFLFGNWGLCLYAQSDGPIRFVKTFSSQKKPSIDRFLSQPPKFDPQKASKHSQHALAQGVLHIYRYASGSQADYVLKLERKDKKFLLLHSVEHFRLSNDGFLYVKDNRRFHIIDLKTNKKYVMQKNAACLDSPQAYWIKDRLVTYAPEFWEESKGKTFACVWNKRGEIIQRFEVDAAWSVVGNDFAFPGELGILPQDPTTYYFLDWSQSAFGGTKCNLWLTRTSGFPKGTVIVLDGLCSQETGLVDRLDIDYEYMRFPINKPIRVRQVDGPKAGQWQEIAPETYKLSPKQIKEANKT